MRQYRRSDDHCQEIIEVVSDAAGQHRNALQPLCLRLMLLGLLAPGDVLRDPAHMPGMRFALGADPTDSTVSPAYAELMLPVSTASCNVLGV